MQIYLDSACRETWEKTEIYIPKSVGSNTPTLKPTFSNKTDKYKHKRGYVLCSVKRRKR